MLGVGAMGDQTIDTYLPSSSFMDQDLWTLTSMKVLMSALAKVLTVHSVPPIFGTLCTGVGTTDFPVCTVCTSGKVSCSSEMASWI